MGLTALDDLDHQPLEPANDVTFIRAAGNSPTFDCFAIAN